jgi:hypothetical protein
MFAMGSSTFSKGSADAARVHTPESVRKSSRAEPPRVETPAEPVAPVEHVLANLCGEACGLW